MPSCNSSCCVVIAAWLGVHPITALVAVVIINRFIIITSYKTRSKLGLYISSHDLSKNCSILDICVVAVGSALYGSVPVWYVRRVVSPFLLATITILLNSSLYYVIFSWLFLSY